MDRLVLSKNIDGLREFHAMGIPLDFALDCAVQRGNMQIIEELLNNLCVSPSESTLLRAMKRGITIRNMFLARVTPTVRHLNCAVIAEHFDTANVLLDRGIAPNLETVCVLKPAEERSEERRVFIDRIVNTLDTQILKTEAAMRRMPLWTSIAQFERALDRAGPRPAHESRRLLTECLRDSAPGHARALINRGVEFLPEHLHVVGEGSWHKSDTNPKGLFGPVLSTTLETAIEQRVIFSSAEEMFHLVSPLVRDHCFEADHRDFLGFCDLFARACPGAMRPALGRYILTEAGNKQRRNRGLATLEDLNTLIDQLRETFNREPALEHRYDSGASPGI